MPDLPLNWSLVRLTVFFLVGLALSLSCASAKNVTIHPPEKSVPIPVGRQLGDVRFDCDAKDSDRCTIRQFLVRSRVCAFIVVKAGQIRLQWFNRHPDRCKGPDESNEPDGWRKLYGIASVTKSLTSTLLGQAIAQKRHAKTRADFEAVVQEPIDKFVPELANSAYAGAPLEKILGMRSGVRWSEYGWYGFFADSVQFTKRVRNKPNELSVVDFAQKYHRRDREYPFNYSALDAAVAAVAAERILNRKLTAFLEQGLWASIGADAEATMGVDKVNTAIGPCCFRLRAGDLVRFGLLVLHKGKDPRGRQIIPTAWFDLATTPAPDGRNRILEGNASYNRGCPLSYRYFWWLFPNQTDFTAIGMGGQFVHVYPDKDTLIVQLSDWHDGGDELECETFRAHDALMRAMH